MQNINPLLLCDGYKCVHRKMYPENTTLVYSNFSPRKSRIPEDKGMILFGLQYILKEYLIRQFNENFFNKPKAEVVKEYSDFMDDYIGHIDVDHIADLHDLGYLPLIIKSLPEGTLVPIGTPCFVLWNTHPKFFWLTNYLETLISNLIWKPCTSATTARHFRNTFYDYAVKTGGNLDFVQYQGHDFSLRGMSGIEDGCLSGAGHLLMFKGTDSVPAIQFIKNYYNGTNNIGHSVNANEHSVVSAGGDANEIDTIIRLITKVCPTGIFSYVMDTWDFWGNITTVLPLLKDIILARDGKFVCRPDTGVPHKIINGDPNGEAECEKMGMVRCLDRTFGSINNSLGYKSLNPKIGWIYGDGINREEQRLILQGLMDNGFATDSGVLGLGSYTYQYTTRDVYSTCCKALFCEVNGVGRPLHKSPKTGAWKKSHKGLLRVNEDLSTTENVTWADEGGLLQPVFRDGQLLKDYSWEEVRENANR